MDTAVESVTLLGMTFGEFFSKIVIIVIAVVVAIVLERVLTKLLRSFLERIEMPKASIFINILRVVIWTIALLSVLKPVFGIDPSGFITALGVTSLALSLGLQDTISNVVSGIALTGGKVVAPGDVITVGSITGTVTDVTWRSTSVRTRAGDVEVIPNSVLNNTSLTHVSDSMAGLCSVSFAVDPAADSALVADEVVSIADEALGELADPAFATKVFFSEITAYGTTVKVSMHVKPDVAFVVAQDRVSRAIQGKPWLATAVTPVGADDDVTAMAAE